MLISTPISVGELIDKITILTIKQARIKDTQKIVHIETELTALQQVVAQNGVESAELNVLMQALRDVNEALWDIEDAIRLCEKAKDFSGKFIQLARDVYITNDKRAKLKREINTLTNSALHEVKSYEDYA
jgi:hypothetical protein